ncbi:hypothetical protein EMPG_16003 [Blastomyces silverae]|uniref:AAA+ ATPase domain-containing protein n=1 Tax=Blastomyces silverae TaxID=2060906 RepID=A0A0H1BB23_9EURO|nr:hypothetical protein EMPG_16003 [Blastomyces silverae]
MAAIALERVMGQHDQRTLHPFFGKGPNDTDPPSSESPPLRSVDPEARAAVRKDVVNIPIEPTSGSDNPDRSCMRLSSRSSRKRDGRLQLQLTSAVQHGEPIVEDEDVNASRKKRRKTQTPEPAGQVTEGLVRQHLVQHNPVPSLGEQLECAAQGDVNGAEKYSAAWGVDLSATDTASEKSQNQPFSSLLESCQPCLKTVNTNPNPDDPPVKTLRLNPNGKLLNSPLRSESESRSLEERSKKRKPTAQKRSKKHSAIVTLRYGVNEESRSLIGRQINEIIGGRKRYSSLREAVSIPTSQQPSKPTHPFFLGKAQRTEEKAEQSKDSSTDHLACPQKDRIATASNLSEHSPQIPQPPSNFSSGGPDTSKTPGVRPRSLFPKIQDPIDPIWPPRGAVHVRGLSPNDDNNSSFMDFEERKAKGLVASIPEYENILFVQSRLLPHINKRDAKSAVLRCPNKRTCSRDTLLEIAMNRLGLTATPMDTIGEHVPRQRTSMPYTSHPAVAQLLSSVRSTTTAFERGGFDDSPWTQKYAPSGADFVLQLGTEALVLKKWLQSLTVSTVNSGTSGSDGKQPKQIPDDGAKRKRRKRPKDLDGFIVSSDDEEPRMDEISSPNDEDELAGGVTISNKRTVVRSDNPIARNSKSAPEKRPVPNLILISGPSGCGKTAAVYGVAKELGFEIFEINAGSRRSARDVVERVGDMTQNHLVQLLGQVDDNSPTASSLKSMFSTPNTDTGKQSTMQNFFKQDTNTSGTRTTDKDGAPAPDGKAPVPKMQPSQKQSLILFEEVDILFEEDKQFWSGVLTLISQSKRPIIMTCNDESLLPLELLKLHAILRFRQPPCDLAVDYLLLLAANEGHILDREWISELYTVMRGDLRATIMQLNFWCQMAVGSKKSGLDWLTTPSVWRGGYIQQANLPRVVSTDTYVHGMGLVCQDLARDEDPYERRSQLMYECLGQWQMGLMDWHESKMCRGKLRSHDGQSSLEALAQESQEADMRANLDIICRGSPDAFSDDVLDLSWPDMTSKQRSTYTEGYQLLQTDLLTDYACLSTKIGVSMTVLLGDSFHDSSPSSDENAIIQQALEKFTSHKPTYLKQSDLRDTFEPVMGNPDPFNPPAGRQSFSFDSGTAPIAEDLAPYIRAIVTFDLRLEQHRLALSGPISLDSKSNKRVRTTRASRAALEGGDKASVRKDKWFTGKLNAKSVLATGCLEWQDAVGWEIHRASGGQVLGKEEGNQSMDEQGAGSSSEGGI